MTTNIDTKLEDVRILSKLSEQLHYIDINGNKFACFGGNVIPYSMVGSFLIWAWTGSRVYYNLYKESNMVEIIKSLNPHDDAILYNPEDAAWYLSKKLRTLMASWDEQHFDNIFEQALM